MHWPIFVISLDDAHDRRTLIQKQCDAHGLTFEFIDAIDGRRGLPPGLEHKIDRDGSVANMGRSMADSEFACALSHQMVYERVIQDELPGAIILEDDAIFGERFTKFINAGGHMAAEIVQMDHSQARHWFWVGGQQFEEVRLIPIAENTGPTTGYSISNYAAKYIISKSSPIMGVADWPCDLIPLKPLVTLPILVHQPPPDLLHSTLEADRQSIAGDRRKAGRWRRFGHAHYWRRRLRRQMTRRIS